MNLYMLVCSKYIVTFSKIYSIILYKLGVVLGSEAFKREFMITSRFNIDSNYNSTKLQSELQCPKRPNAACSNLNALTPLMDQKCMERYSREFWLASSV